jgi:hypothetical protein
MAMQSYVSAEFPRISTFPTATTGLPRSYAHPAPGLSFSSRLWRRGTSSGLGATETNFGHRTIGKLAGRDPNACPPCHGPDELDSRLAGNSEVTHATAQSFPETSPTLKKIWCQREIRTLKHLFLRQVAIPIRTRLALGAQRRI